MDMLISSVPPVAWVGVRCGDSAEKKSVAWDAFLMCSLAERAYGGSLQVMTLPSPAKSLRSSAGWKDGLILSGEGDGEEGRFIHPKSIIRLGTGVALAPHPAAPSLGTLGEGLVALMAGMAASQVPPWPQCFPVAHDVFGLHSNVPER